jgi:hypothetical protein
MISSRSVGGVGFRFSLPPARPAKTWDCLFALGGAGGGFRGFSFVSCVAVVVVVVALGSCGVLWGEKIFLLGVVRILLLCYAIFWLLSKREGMVRSGPFSVVRGVGGCSEECRFPLLRWFGGADAERAHLVLAEARGRCYRTSRGRIRGVVGWDS